MLGKYLDHDTAFSFQILPSSSVSSPLYSLGTENFFKSSIYNNNNIKVLVLVLLAVYYYFMNSF
jgi:hypothetical protein